MPRCTVLTAWERNLLCHAPGRYNGAGALCRCSTSYSPTPTLSACRSSQACSSLTGISLRRPRRTSRTSGSICARHVSQDTPSAWHACSTLSARAGALRFWAARVAAACGDIGAIVVIDPDLLGSAIQLREVQTPSREERRTDRLRPSLERPCQHAAFRPLRDRASHGSALFPTPAPRASTAYGLRAGLPAYARSQHGSPLRGSLRIPSACAHDPPACLTAAPAARAPGAQHQARTDYGYEIRGGLAVRSCS